MVNPFWSVFLFRIIDDIKYEQLSLLGSVMFYMFKINIVCENEIKFVENN
jgi:hypothetical protein